MKRLSGILPVIIRGSYRTAGSLNARIFQDVDTPGASSEK